MKSKVLNQISPRSFVRSFPNLPFRGKKLWLRKFHGHKSDIIVKIDGQWLMQQFLASEAVGQLRERESWGTGGCYKCGSPCVTLIRDCLIVWLMKLCRKKIFIILGFSCLRKETQTINENKRKRRVKVPFY